mmetsp:Transcript_16999/g.30226  ORF Transcript_16999/g.30226 Transcript_16999/m.30226 type:complete len:218 (-) Transcript_16999:1199-1852(-)
MWHGIEADVPNKNHTGQGPNIPGGAPTARPFESKRGAGVPFGAALPRRPSKAGLWPERALLDQEALRRDVIVRHALLVQPRKSLQSLTEKSVASLLSEQQLAQTTAGRRCLLNNDECLPLDAIAKDCVQVLVHYAQLSENGRRLLELDDGLPPSFLPIESLLLRRSHRVHAAGASNYRDAHAMFLEDAIPPRLVFLGPCPLIVQIDLQPDCFGGRFL